MNIVFDMDKIEQTSQKKELDRKNMLVVIILGSIAIGLYAGFIYFYSS